MYSAVATLAAMAPSRNIVGPHWGSPAIREDRVRMIPRSRYVTGAYESPVAALAAGLVDAGAGSDRNTALTLS